MPAKPAVLSPQNWRHHQRPHCIPAWWHRCWTMLDNLQGGSACGNVMGQILRHSMIVKLSVSRISCFSMHQAKYFVLVLYIVVGQRAVHRTRQSSSPLSGSRQPTCILCLKSSTGASITDVRRDATKAAAVSFAADPCMSATSSSTCSSRASASDLCSNYKLLDGMSMGSCLHMIYAERGQFRPANHSLQSMCLVAWTSQ